MWSHLGQFLLEEMLLFSEFGPFKCICFSTLFIQTVYQFTHRLSKSPKRFARLHPYQPAGEEQEILIISLFVVPKLKKNPSIWEAKVSLGPGQICYPKGV